MSNTPKEKTILLEKVTLPVSGKKLTIAAAVKLGYAKTYVRDGVKYLEWADHAFPPESDRMMWERSERKRIQGFINSNPDLPHPGELNATIKTDNGRLRLYFEISEHSSLDEDVRRLEQLKKLKQRLVRFDGKRDPQPHPVSLILEELEQAGQISTRKKHVLVVQEINRWIAERLCDWEKGDGPARRFIDIELFGVLRLFKFNDVSIENILNKAQARIRNRLSPFIDGRSPKALLIKRDAPPVSPERLKSLARTWKKRQQPF